MYKTVFRALALAVSLLLANTAVPNDNPHVTLATNRGDVVIELFAEQSPVTVQNFLRYVAEGYYDGTIFHRVIKDFMVQGGGFKEGMLKKDGHESIKNESDNKLSNERGTLAMARTNKPHSATSQFFINVVDNEFLDFGARGEGEWGYAVFGKVIEGMDVVDDFVERETTTVGPYRDVPVEAIVIQSARADIAEETQ